jgi:flagellar biosynthesis component FlhA
MIPVFLWLLATIDSAFIGYREAAGRNAQIDKRAYYRRALIRGALVGQVAVLIVGVITAIMLVSSNDAGALFSKLESVGARMLTVYLPYAVILLITFCIRALPSVDIRSITSVLIFGPFTFIRPAVVLGGAVWGVVAAPGAITIVLTVLIVCLMLGLGGTLSWLRSRGLIS